MKQRTAMQKAVFFAGGGKQLAAACGVSYHTVVSWVKYNRPPAERVIRIEEATGGQVTRYELRPDVFGERRIPVPDYVISPRD